MKKLLLFSSLLLSGCQVYEFPNETPRLTGGKWVLSNYDIVVINSISNVTVIKNDTVCINAFNGQSYVSGNVLMKQFYNQTAKDRRFVIGKTTWEFDSNGNHLYCDFMDKNGSLMPTHNPYWVNMSGYTKNISISNVENGGVTNYTFETNTIGVNPPKILKLLSPEIVTDLYVDGGKRDKGVTVRVLLTFMR
jgi:hypothetical protein